MKRQATFVISGLQRGGAEAQLVAIATALSARGWSVTVLSFLPISPDSLSSELHDTGVRLLSLNASSGLLKYVSLASAIRFVRRIRPDILIGFMYHGIMTARIVGRTTGVPINVSSIHSDRHGSFRELVMRVTDGLTDARHGLVETPRHRACRQASCRQFPRVCHSQLRGRRPIRHAPLQGPDS